MNCIKGKIFSEGKFVQRYLYFDKKIIKISKKQRKRPSFFFDYSNEFITPGFIDMHTNGALGVDFTKPSPDINKFLNFAYSQGITTTFPTFISMPFEGLKKLLQNFDLKKFSGIHLEGPFISHLKMGVHKYRQEVEISYLEKIKNILPPNFKVILTFAPELNGAKKILSFSKKSGWILSAGHTDADSKTADLFIKNGTTLCTHLFNVMTGLDHRKGGVALSYLNSNRAFVQIIPDGIHISLEMLSFLKKTKHISKIIIVTDNLPPVGLKNNSFMWCNQKIMIKNNIAKIDGKLAGGLLKTNDIFNNLKKAGYSIEEIVKMRTENPASCLKLKNTGKLKQNYKSDICVINENFEIVSVFKNGTEVFRS